MTNDARSPAHPPVVLHIPHSATSIPADVRRTLLVSDEELRRERLLVTDWYTDELFAVPSHAATTVRFPVSRLVVDPERFQDDEREVMAERGIGVVYTRTTEGEPLREVPSPAEREELLRRFYQPHHAALAAAVEAARARHGHCLVIDCHSFPSRPLPWELDQVPDRPDICLGTDAFHTPASLTDLARRLFESAGFSVAIDRPFSGALVPAAHFGREPSVRALMIEINRRLYMDEGSGDKLSSFIAVSSTIKEVLSTLIGTAAAMQP